MRTARLLAPSASSTWPDVLPPTPARHCKPPQRQLSRLLSESGAWHSAKVSTSPRPTPLRTSPHTDCNPHHAVSQPPRLAPTTPARAVVALNRPSPSPSRWRASRAVHPVPPTLRPDQART